MAAMTGHGNICFILSEWIMLTMYLMKINASFPSSQMIVPRPAFLEPMNRHLKAHPWYAVCYKGLPLFNGMKNVCSEQDTKEGVESLVNITRQATDIEETPDVSIILPYHNKPIMTCQSMSEMARSEIPLEFVIVCDGCHSRSARIVQWCAKSLQIFFSTSHIFLRNREPLGYGQSCNIAASRARSSLLLFTNNDMFVGLGCLHALLSTITNDNSTGIVGPMFVGHNMIVQEYGGIIYSDGSAANAYRGQTGLPKDVRMTHEVDYISAACILVRSSLFRDSKGFDPRYEQGYFEDTDLAMSARDLGYKVMIQPFAMAFHQEGGTFGRESKLKIQLMNKNGRRFREKWHKHLKLYSPPGSSPLQSRIRYRNKSILFVDHYILTPFHDSGSQRAWQILNIFISFGFQVDFLPMTTMVNEEMMYYVALMRSKGIRIISKMDSLAHQVNKKKCPYKLVIVSRPQTFQNVIQHLESCSQQVPTFYDTVDLHFLRETREVLVSLGQTPLEPSSIISLVKCGAYATDIQVSHCIMQHTQVTSSAVSRFLQMEISRIYSIMNLERRAITVASATFVVSDSEKKMLSNLGLSDNTLHIIPNIYSDTAFANAIDLIQNKNASERRNGAIFVANFQHTPNIQALQNLLKIADFIGRVDSQFVMHIVGSHHIPEDLALEIQSRKMIKYHGWLSDQRLKSLFLHVACSFAPLTYGAGVKGKVAESYFHGIPVVGSRIATEGMGLRDGIEFLLAENQVEYMKHYKALTGNRTFAEGLVASGLQVLQQTFSVSKATRTLSDMLTAHNVTF